MPISGVILSDWGAEVETQTRPNETQFCLRLAEFIFSFPHPSLKENHLRGGYILPSKLPHNLSCFSPTSERHKRKYAFKASLPHAKRDRCVGQQDLSIARCIRIPNTWMCLLLQSASHEMGQVGTPVHGTIRATETRESRSQSFATHRLSFGRPVRARCCRLH